MDIADSFLNCYITNQYSRIWISAADLYLFQNSWESICVCLGCRCLYQPTCVDL